MSLRTQKQKAKPLEKPLCRRKIVHEKRRGHVRPAPLSTNLVRVAANKIAAPQRTNRNSQKIRRKSAETPEKLLNSMNFPAATRTPALERTTSCQFAIQMRETNSKSRARDCGA